MLNAGAPSQGGSTKGFIHGVLHGCGTQFRLRCRQGVFVDVDQMHRHTSEYVPVGGRISTTATGGFSRCPPPSGREIAASTGARKTALYEPLAHGERAGIGWPFPDDIDDEQLEAILYLPPSTELAARRPRDAPRRLGLYTVLLALQGATRRPRRRDASQLQSRGEDVRRLLWRHDAVVRPSDRSMTWQSSLTNPARRAPRNRL